MAVDTKQQTQDRPRLTTLDGNEVGLIDALLAVRHPVARTGDPTACDQVIRLLDLRLRYTRERKQAAAW